MRELVPFEMLKSDGKIAFDRDALLVVQCRCEELEQPPTETSMANFIGVDFRENIPKRSIGHFETFGADQRDGNGFTHASDMDDVAERGSARRRVLV